MLDTSTPSEIKGLSRGMEANAFLAGDLRAKGAIGRLQALIRKTLKQRNIDLDAPRKGLAARFNAIVATNPELAQQIATRPPLVLNPLVYTKGTAPPESVIRQANLDLLGAGTIENSTRKSVTRGKRSLTKGGSRRRKRKIRHR